jgi:hypothetical protein
VDFVEKGRKFSTGILTEIKKTIGLSHYINWKTIFGENTPVKDLEAYMDLIGDNYGHSPNVAIWIRDAVGAGGERLPVTRSGSVFYYFINTDK